MKLIIEEYQYRAADVRDVLSGISSLENAEGMVSVNYVGYCFNPGLKDCVFILPKVLLETVRSGDGTEKELVFGRYPPEDLISIDDSTHIDAAKRDFIYDFSVWIYRTIKVYQQLNPESGIVLHRQNAEVWQSQKHLSNTFLDIIIALENFGRKNRQFLFRTVRDIHSGFSRIRWPRTIAHTPSVIQDESAVYLRPVCRKAQINFDEELIVIFYSILSFISEHYGFSEEISLGYELIRGKKFQVYLNGYGVVRLRQIRYRYFSDRAIELWNLCYAFFDRARKVITDVTENDYLLVKNFNIVFEAIIDELVGDPESEIPEGLKDQLDGKVIDHLFTGQGLITHEEDSQVYFIGDSKYYKQGTPVGKNSVYKQFTYARNVIQWNLDLFMNEDDDRALLHDREKFGSFRLRDDLTEGYNVIPNFFISSMLTPELDFRDDIELTSKKEKCFRSEQFGNRLFDRDTLLVCHYDVNFLFVVSLYARNNRLEKKEWKKKVRKLFRDEIQKMLTEQYEFSVMRAHPDVNAEKFIQDHFKKLLGKIFTPFRTREIYSLALDRKYGKDNSELKKWLSRYFFISPCRLGENPENVLPKASELTAVTEADSRKNVLVTEVHQGDIDYGLSENGEAVSFLMKEIPEDINLRDISYLLPVTDGQIQGYYPVREVKFVRNQGGIAIRFMLGENIRLGSECVNVSEQKIRSGTLFSQEECLKIYRQ